MFEIKYSKNRNWILTKFFISYLQKYVIIKFIVKFTPKAITTSFVTIESQFTRKLYETIKVSQNNQLLSY